MPPLDDTQRSYGTSVAADAGSSGGSSGGAPRGKLSRDDALKIIREEIPGLSKAGSEGVLRNMVRESGLDPTNDTGDGGTSIGLFQHHNDRATKLKAFAKEQGADWRDPRIQVRFAGKELKNQFPTLYSQLTTTTDAGEAEDRFKRVFEKPASVMWGNTPQQLASEKYRWSDYALNEHKGRPNTDVYMMSPSEYLDLSPELEGKPFESPSGRSLKKSVDRGDQIESIPTLDTDVRGNTAVVTDQDGRHRALLAKENGLTSIPVAVRQNGEGQPTEIQGMTGNVLPHDFPKAEAVPQSMWSKAMGMLIPSAEAATPAAGQAIPDWMKGEVVRPAAQAAPQGGQQPQQQQGLPPWMKGDVVQPASGQQQEQKAEPDGAVMSAVKGAGAGFGKMVLGGQELVGKGLEAAGATDTGKWLVDDARQGVKNLNETMAPDQAAHPWATAGGEIAGSMAIPGAGGTAMAMRGVRPALAALGSGAISGALQPGGSDGHYWGDKALDVGEGAALSLGGNALTQRLAGAISPAVRNAIVRPAAEMARRAGYVLPPASIMEEPGLVTNALAGIGGKIKLQQAASAKNQVVTNKLAAEALGLPPDTTLTDEILNAVRSRAGRAYQEVKDSIPAIAADDAFQDVVAGLGGQNSQAALAFPKLMSISGLKDLTDELGLAGEQPTGVWVELVKKLRYDANALLKARDDPSKLALGLAKREAANAVDDMMERQIAAAGNDGAVDAYRAARRLIAKSYDVESATNSTTGDVSARALARLQDKGRPLTDQLKTIADTASAFPKAMQSPASFGDNEMFSALDAYGAAASLLHGRPEILGAIAGRPIARAALLSEGYQNRLATPYLAPARRVADTILDRALQPIGVSRNALAGAIRQGGPAVGSALSALAQRASP